VNAPLKKSEPLLAGVQGESKSACATECVGAKKWNSIEDPGEAVSVLGEKEMALLAPTVMV